MNVDYFTYVESRFIFALNDSLLDKKFPQFITELMIPRAVGNNITGDLKIAGLPKLTKITVSKFTLQNLNSVVIKNNPRLEDICFEDGNDWDEQRGTGNGCFENAKVLKIYSTHVFFHSVDLPSLHTLYIGKSAFANAESLLLKSICYSRCLPYLPMLSFYRICDYAFNQAKEFIVDSMLFKRFECDFPRLSKSSDAATSFKRITYSRLSSFVH